MYNVIHFMKKKKKKRIHAYLIRNEITMHSSRFIQNCMNLQLASNYVGTKFFPNICFICCCIKHEIKGANILLTTFF